MIKCLVCGGEFTVITHSHLRLHGMKVKEYKHKYSTVVCDSEWSEKYRQASIARGAIPPNLCFQQRSMSRLGGHCHFKDPVARGRAISAALAISPKRKACEELQKITRLGKNNPNYKGGCKYLYISAPEQNEIRNKIRIRDNRKCVVCGDRGWCVHHIDHNQGNWSEDNLITLCNKHHSATNHRKSVEQVKEEYMKEMPSISIGG